ncbi:MAG: tetraacyldisaccharide 4'-kinase [Rikenellaceae bacterium]
MIKDLILSILAGLYSFAIAVRHKLFDWGIIKSNEYDIPIICIGNITVGGTGKTPMTEMIVSYMSKYHTVAVLSRGYGRKTKGYMEVKENSHYRDVGDEPLQIKLKFPNIVVAVCEKRVNGIEQIRKKHPDVNLIIMDDGFQHRHVEPKINVIMVDATRPPHEDQMLPLGRLRDRFDSLHRAHYFIVSKCPENMTPLDRRIMRKVLVSMAYQEVYFTRLESFKPIPVFAEGKEREIKPNSNVIAIAGIGNPTPFIGSLQKSYNVVDATMFNDHHVYKMRDINLMSSMLKKHPDSVIITTEKDAVKLIKSNKIAPEVRKNIFYIPINISFVDDSKVDFLKKLHQDVIKN